LLHELLPNAGRIAYLGQSAEWEAPWGQAARKAAQVLGLTMVLANHPPNDYDGAFALIRASQIDALFIAPSAIEYAHRHIITEFARKTQLPDVHAYREAVEAGGLMSYGADAPDPMATRCHPRR
jgi:putative tryptophan/tyrosine transport system substrate-binding protein